MPTPKIEQWLKDNLKLEVRDCPEFHAGETGYPYLCLVLNDKVISTISGGDLRTVLEQGHTGGSYYQGRI